jgi:glucose/arabinose dehydrogenase
MVALAVVLAGCRGNAVFVPIEQRTVIDRQVVEYPTGFALTLIIDRLQAPTAIAFDTDDPEHAGTVIVAEGGLGDDEQPRLVGFRPDGSQFQIYPKVGRLASLNPFGGRDRLYGPIGGLCVSRGEIFVTHRDATGRGVVSAITYAGVRRTVVGELPAQGDHSVTAVVVNPINDRLYFGVGSATNSGVVGIDNWERGWVAVHRNFCDQSFVDLKLLGYRFDTPDPAGGFFGSPDTAVSAPYQPFGSSNQTRIRKAANGRPTSAIYSVSREGGDLRVEAHGIRNPAGLVFNEFGALFATNQGMELRGTRPVKDDPDVVVRVPLGGATWFGGFDFSADLLPISDPRFQPEVEMILRTGYPELGALIDHAASGLTPPDRNTLLRGVFLPLSGAAGMDVVPARGGFRDYRGNLIVALSGDRAPFATSGRPLVAPVGYRVMRVDPETRQVRDFVFNASALPASRMKGKVVALERPVDVKFGPDGALYILDLGRVRFDASGPKPESRTGRVFRLSPVEAPSTQP